MTEVVRGTKFKAKEDFEVASDAMTLTDVIDFKERYIFSRRGENCKGC
jgi:hypothetical protein